MKKANKQYGFTLIELLAIIVILAIIAVITAPVILNSIDKSKKGAAENSAYGYLDSIENYYVTNWADDDTFELDGLQKVSNGLLNGEKIKYKGKAPTNGFLWYEENDLISGCLTINGYKVQIDEHNVATTTKGECRPDEIDAQGAYNVKYYSTSWIGSNPIYYDPIKGGLCDSTSEYTESNSNNDFKGTTENGCMKWYAYSEFDKKGRTYVNLLLDHNTKDTVEWVSKDHYKGLNNAPTASSLGITYPNDITFNTGTASWDKGPITLLDQLHYDTDGWKGLPDRSDTYTNSNSNKNSGVVKERFTINYSGYKARLITADEIAHITGAFKSTTDGGIDWSESTSANHYYFDSLTDSSSSTCESGNIMGCSYGWLYDRTGTDCTTTYGCLHNANSHTFGYWTVSPNTDYSFFAWFVGYQGYVTSSNIDVATNVGLRPVITVSKSVILGS